MRSLSVSLSSLIPGSRSKSLSAVGVVRIEHVNYAGDTMGLDFVDFRGFEVPMKRGFA